MPTALTLNRMLVLRSPFLMSSALEDVYPIWYAVVGYD